MNDKHPPSIVDDDNKEEDSLLTVGEKSESKSESEPEPESYEELLKVIHHPSHPNHPLYFHKGESYSTDCCTICRRLLTSFSYRCNNPESKCKFYLDAECADRMPSIKHEEHQHFLTLIERSSEERPCQNCQCPSEYFYARCFPCDINYHVRCGRKGLPDTTIYQLHKHPLFLSYNTNEGKFCDVCKKEVNPNSYHPKYSCEECDYSCHARCVISEIKLDQREKLDHSCHQHVLFLCDEDDKDEASCHVCGNFVHADEHTFTYGCSSCSFYIHKCCIDKLPVLEIAHEFHPHHPLKLYWKKDGLICDACCMKISGFTYRCVECNFDIGLECASKVPSIRDERHQHLLTFFNEMYKTQNCIEKCGLYAPDACFLRCVQCDFNVHLICSPLPKVIKFKGHLHSLALEDYHIEDDFGEYYCDHCEDPRDPKECAYHCAEGCPYVAEFNCVVDEVVRTLNEKQGEVDLFRTVNRVAADEYYYKIVTKGLCLHDVYKSSPEEELELKGLKTKMEMNLESIIVMENLRFGYPIFNLESIEHVREKWSNFPISTMDLKSEVVKMGNYIITKDLQTLFSKIHAKYSHIGDKCSLSEGSKTIVVIQFVQVIHEMIETRISKITEEGFLWWFLRVLFVLHAGFKVDFVLEHIHEIRVARFGLKTRLDRFPELEDYYKEIEVITDEIEVRKAKLARLKTKEEKLTELLLNRSLKDDRYWLLDKLDFTLETAGKGLL